MSSLLFPRLRPHASVLLIVSACSHAQTAQPPPATPQATSAQAAGTETTTEAPAGASSIGAFMADHYVIATYARDCVIAGDIEALREPLQTLADYEYPSVAPGGWLRGIAELQEAARLTARADSIEVAAAGVATMGRICGDCHQSGGQGPVPAPAPPRLGYDGEPDSLAQRMFRHMVGAQQLWEGLTIPSTAAWQAGAYAIGHAPEPADRALPSGFVNALAEVRALGTRGADLQHASERADLYGLLLTTCSDCHARAMEHDL